MRYLFWWFTVNGITADLLSKCFKKSVTERLPYYDIPRSPNWSLDLVLQITVFYSIESTTEIKEH